MSLTSITLTVNFPDLGGFPPSTAVRMSLITDCFSRSKDFCSTNSADTPKICQWLNK
uniref:Uncharacterized protein n=1 Tax=Scophthalmus maximus TaxID=52904 RepID=A0A8D3CCY6_SCOMX